MKELNVPRDTCVVLEESGIATVGDLLRLITLNNMKIILLAEQECRITDLICDYAHELRTIAGFREEYYESLCRAFRGTRIERRANGECIVKGYRFRQEAQKQAGPGPKDPSPHEIRNMCEKFQRQWTSEDLRQRLGLRGISDNELGWYPPTVPRPE